MVGFSQLVRKSDMIMDCDRGLSYKEEFPDKCSVANNLSELPPGVGRWFSARFHLVYLAFFGFVNVYALRVNLSVAIISMVNSSYLTDSNNYTAKECIVNTSHQTATKEGEFNWNGEQRGLVLGAFFYGYILTQIPGGYLASRFGGKMFFGVGVLCASILTMMTPLAARTSLPLLIAVRIVVGIGEGVTFPSMLAMLGVWAPPLERSRMISLALAGSNIGTVVAQPLSGLLCASNVMGGWPSVFYIFGVLGVVWSCIWFRFAHNSPSQHPTISPEEREYIESRIKMDKKPWFIPWREILTSKAVWAINASFFANNWGLYFLLTSLPLFLSTFLGFDITQDGFTASLPYLAFYISSNVTGILADTIIERGLLTITQTRKLAAFIAMNGAAVCLVAAGYVGCNRTAAVSLICLAMMFNGLRISGAPANIIDIAPRYSGILMGIANTWGTIPGFTSPAVVGAVTGNHPDHQHWLYVFYLTAVIYVIGSLIYVCFGTATEQEWNKDTCVRQRVDESRPLLTNDC